MKPWARWMLVCGALLPAHQMVSAQQTASLDTPRTIGTGGTVLDRTISVQIDKQPLTQAVSMVAEKAGTSIGYRRAVLMKYTAPVSVNVTNVPVRAVLDRILAGTMLRATLAEEGRLVIVETDRVDAQAGGEVRGEIVDARTKQAIGGASISLEKGGASAQSGPDGMFRLSNVASGTHTIEVRLLGYVKHRVPVTVANDQVVTVDISLDRSASVLDEVIVTGTVVATSRREVATPITVITGEELEKRNITRIEQLFRGEVPGVMALERGTLSFTEINGTTTQVGNAQTATVYSRGTSGVSNAPTPLKTYVDGVELLDPSYLGTIDPRSIERIEIITGPQAATIYGSGAMGGVMQIFTKHGGRNGQLDATLNLRYGMLQSSLNNGYTPAHDHSLLLNGGNGADFNYSVTGSYSYQGQWQPQIWGQNLGLSAGLRHQRGILQIGASLSITSSRNGVSGEGGDYVCLTIDSYCYSPLVTRMLREMGDLPPASSTSGYFVSRVSRSLAQNVSADINLRPLPIWQHSLTVGRVTNAFDVDPERPVFATPSDSLYRWRWSDGTRTTANYSTTLSPSFGAVATTLTLGGSYSSGTSTRYVGRKVSLNSQQYVSSAGVAGSVSATPGIDDESWGGFGLFRVGFFDRLYLSFGLRGERNPNYGSNHAVDWTPTEGITYTIETGDLSLKLLASYGSATRAPGLGYREAKFSTDFNRTPEIILSYFANPQLVPERSRGPQGGFELSYGNWGSFTLNRYDQRVADLIMILPVDSISIMYSWATTPQWTKQYQYQNVATVRQHGWESTGSLNLGPLSVKGTYSLTEARTLSINPTAYSADGSASYGVGEARRGLPSHFGSFTASYAHGPTSVSWTGSYVGSATQGMTSVWQYVENNSRITSYRLRARWDSFTGVTPGYLKHDVAASQRLSGRTSLLLNVRNLSGNYGSDFSELFPSLGRQTQLGVSVRFL